MTTAKHPPGATLHLGGDAYAHPDLEPLLVPIQSVTPYPGNPRRGDQDAVTGSIRDHGLYAGVTAQASTGHILVGNHRHQALLALGATRIPRTSVDVDDTRAAAIVARDNYTSDRAGYDDTARIELLAALDAEGALDLSGYAQEDYAALLRAQEPPPAAHTDPDDAPDLPTTQPISQAGDVWRLGPHILIVDDATTAATYERLLTSTDQVRAVIADPPYGVDVQGRDRQQAGVGASSKFPRRRDGKGVTNDDLTGEALTTFLTTALGHAYKVTQPGGVWYVCSPPGDLMGMFGATLATMPGTWRHTLIWVKDQFVMGRADYHYRHEVLFYGWKPGAAHHFVADRTQDTVWEVPRPKRSQEHPTMKPVALIARAVRNSTRPGDLVLDPFAGSGTTLIACHQEDRTARLIELDPRYADVICRRYQEHTGTLPVRDGVQVNFTLGVDT